MHISVSKLPLIPFYPVSFASNLQHPYPLDFDSFENENLALLPAHAEVVAAHRKLLEMRFKGTDSEAGCPPDIGPDGKELEATFLEVM